MPTTPPYTGAPFFSQVIAGLGSFSEAYFTSDQESILARQWSDFHARRLRYATFWSHFENNVYRKIHTWSDLHKSTYGLYAYTRSIYSPANRLGEFWASHLWGGKLDPDAGDGQSDCSSALPIVTEFDELRPAIAQVWRDSNWQANKETFTRFGAVLGDVGIAIVDDIDRQKVYFRVVHPKTIAYLGRDPFGNVKEYILEERRIDPRLTEEQRWMNPQLVTFAEWAEKVGEKVVFRTYLNNQPFDWRDYPTDSAPKIGPEWTEDYGFVPFVFVQHRDMGLGWGWSELHPSISKLHELDDAASKLDDWIRKTVDSPWFFSGARPPESQPDGTATVDNELVVSVPNPKDDKDEPGRSRIPTIYANDPNARAQPLVAPLDVSATSAHVLSILKELERDHPELQADMATASGDASGRALRVARERVEAMVDQRRAGYDDALVRAIQMALSIGGAKGYRGFEGITADSYATGRLALSIGPRPVFAVDELDKLEEEGKRAAVLDALVKAGLPLPLAMQRAGYSQEDIDAVKADLEQKQAENAARLEAMKERVTAVQPANPAGSRFGGPGETPLPNEGGGNGVVMAGAGAGQDNAGTY